MAIFGSRLLAVVLVSVKLIIPGDEVVALEFPIDISLVVERHCTCRSSSVSPAFDDASLVYDKPLGLLSFRVFERPPFEALLLSSFGIELGGAPRPCTKYSVWQLREITLGPIKGSFLDPLRDEISSISRSPY